MKQLFLAVALFFSVGAFAQAKNPAKFTFEAVKKTADTYEIVITANVESPWHIYSQNTPKGGPVPTKITFKANPLVKLNGAAKEVGKMENVKDKTFGVNVMYYSNKVQFVQTVKVKAGTKTNISGTIEYMVCDDEMCLPPKKVPFEVKL